MSDTNAIPNSADEAPNVAPPAVPVVEETIVKTIITTEINKEEIPAADGVKEVEEEKIEKTNGKTEEKASKPPADPKEDPIGWVNSLFPEAMHKVNYQVLNWMQQVAVEDEDKRQPLPGKNEAVTKKQFLGFLRDGTVLAKLAKRFQPDSVETVYEGEDAKDKEKQAANINAFINFVKEKVGLSEQQVFTASDLQDKGKSGYQSVLNTIIQLGLKSNEKFEQKGIDIEQLVEVASQAVHSSLMQTILNFFRRARPAQTTKQLAKEAEEKEKAEKAAEKVVEEKVEKVVVTETPAVVEKTAVSAN